MPFESGENWKGNADGRPTVYSDELCQKLIDFFDVEPFEDKEIPHYQEDGTTIKWKDHKRVQNRLPTLRRFAKQEGINHQTIYNWLKKGGEYYKEKFADAYEIAKQMREDFLVENGLQGLIPPATFKFVAVNYTKMRDSQDLNLGGQENKPVTIILYGEKPKGPVLLNNDEAKDVDTESKISEPTTPESA